MSLIEFDDSPFGNSEVAVNRITSELKRILPEIIANDGIVIFKVHPTHLGDNYITTYAVDLCLRKFLSQNNISYSNLKISTFDTEEDTNTFNLSELLAREIPSQKIEAYRRHTKSYLYGLIAYFTDLMGLQWTQEETNQIVNTPPLPLPNYGLFTSINPMALYSEDRVLEWVNRLKLLIDAGKTYIVITHGGSKGIKRMARDQLRGVLGVLREKLPDFGFIILTAQSIDGNGGPELTGSDADIVINATEDINKTIAIFRIPTNIVYVTTDTFLSWLGAGSIASRADHDQQFLNPTEVFVLYTIASPEYWGIPGAVRISSDALEKYDSKQLRSGFFLLNDAIYIHDPDGIYSEPYDETDPHVRDEDLAKLIANVVNRLSPAEQSTD